MKAQFNTVLILVGIGFCLLNSCQNKTNSESKGEMLNAGNKMYVDSELELYDTNTEIKDIDTFSVNDLKEEPSNIEEKEHSNFEVEPFDFKIEFNYFDTILVKSSEELLKTIKSNRLIKLVDIDYILNRNSEYYPQGILFDSIHDFKLMGAGKSKLLAFERNATVLIFTNSFNVELNNLTIGHTEEPNQNCEEGVLKFIDCQNIKIKNCKLFGSGTYGLTVSNVRNLLFNSSSITECTNRILSLANSLNIKFIDSKFYNNTISSPNLAGFSESKDVIFEGSEIVDNETTQPDLAENSIFEIYNNKDQIQFNNCTFLRNKNFNWFGDKIKLNSCKIDSSKFADFQGNYPNGTK